MSEGVVGWAWRGGKGEGGGQGARGGEGTTDGDRYPQTRRQQGEANGGKAADVRASRSVEELAAWFDPDAQSRPVVETERCGR